MAELTEQQVDMIAGYIQRKGVAQDALVEDLLDHICTSIETQLDAGETFDTAFDKTIKLFGPEGLKQVQQLTFELLTEMNATMKKVTFSFGLISTILLLAGTIFKLMHWPGAGIMVVLGAGLLVLVYLPTLLWHKIKESPPNEYALHFSGFAGLTLTTLGVLFKIMHWPGASVLLIGGLLALGVLYIPIFFYKRFQSSANKPITLSTGLVAITCLVLTFALISVNTSSEFDRTISLINMELDATSERLSANAPFYAQLNGISEADMLRKSAQESFDYLENLKLELIAQTEEVSREKAAKLQVNNLKQKFNYDIPTHILFGTEGNSDFSMAAVKKELLDFQSMALAMVDASDRKLFEANLPFDFTQTYTLYENDKNWEDYHFYRVPLIAVLSQLSKLQVDIRNVEMQTLLHLTNQLESSTPPTGG